MDLTGSERRKGCTKEAGEPEGSESPGSRGAGGGAGAHNSTSFCVAAGRGARPSSLLCCYSVGHPGLLQCGPPRPGQGAGGEQEAGPGRRRAPGAAQAPGWRPAGSTSFSRGARRRDRLRLRARSCCHPHAWGGCGMVAACGWRGCCGPGSGAGGLWSHVAARAAGCRC